MSKPKVVLGDGNAFSILGRCAKAARRASWPEEKWQGVKKEMTSGDYDHLLAKAQEHFDVELEDDCG
jgi:hypothetical protein